MDNFFLIVKEYSDGIFNDMWPLLRFHYFRYSGGILPTVAIIGIYFNLRKPIVLAVLMHAFIICRLYNFHHTPGWPQHGARYYYSTWVGLGILIGFGLADIYTFLNSTVHAKIRNIISITALLAVVSYQLDLQNKFLITYRYQFDFVKRFEEELIFQCDADKIVLLDQKSWETIHIPQFKLK